MRRIKFFWQRHTRGFDDTETWDLHCTLCEFLLPRLKRYRKIAPEIIADERLEDGNWFEIVDRMIEAVEFIVEDPIGEMEMEDYIQKEKDIQEGLDLLGKYLRHLWF